MNVRVWGQANSTLHYNSLFGKVVFFVIDLTWKLFSETGNIETYLLYKEMEGNVNDTSFGQIEDEKETPMDTNI